MEKDILINDLKKIVGSKPDIVKGKTGFYLLSAREINGVIELLEKKE